MSVLTIFYTAPFSDMVLKPYQLNKGRLRISFDITAFKDFKGSPFQKALTCARARNAYNLGRIGLGYKCIQESVYDIHISKIGENLHWQFLNFEILQRLPH